jgi:putative nucleotidyltransferase with HDIG domain
MSWPASAGAPAPTISVQITKKMLQSLAPLPATAVRMLAMLDDPDVSLRRIAEVASGDVGIAAAVLRMANSAILGMRGRVGSISDALRLIGTAQARLVVLTCGVAQAGKKGLPFYCLPAGAFMRHSELTASLSMTVAQRMQLPDIGVAYSAGLLHDIGKVILNGLAAEGSQGAAYEAFRQAAMTPGTDLTQCERAYFGTDHAAVGRDLAMLWALPSEIAGAILEHHHAEPSGGLAQCVSLANAAACAADPAYPAGHCARMPAQPAVPLEPLMEAAAALLA